MKILFIGPDSLPGSLVKSYISAFEKINRSYVTVFDTEKEGLSVRILGDSNVARFKRRTYYYLNNYILKKKLMNRIEKKVYGNVSLIFDFKSHWLGEEDVLKLKNLSGAIVFHLNADSPFDAANFHPNLIKNIPLYDCYFIWNKRLIPKIYSLGAKKVEYLPFAWDPELHPPISSLNAKNGKYESDVVFIGNWTPEREKWLDVINDFDLTIWGQSACRWGRMKKGSKLFDRWKQIPVIGEEFVKVVWSSKINLNFLREQNKGSHNMRTFEVPGCGGFLLTERSEEQCEFFEEDKEIACFSTFDELREKIKFYLLRNEFRHKMAQAAHRKVEREHTYVYRAKQLIKVYQELKR